MFSLRNTLARHRFIYANYHSTTAFREPTIFAPATGKGKSAIAILRISGPQAALVYHRMTLPPVSRNLRAGTEKLKEERGIQERKAMLRRIVHPATGEVLDEGIVIYFPRQSTFRLTDQEKTE